MIDPPEQVSAVDRFVAARDTSDGMAEVVLISQVYPTGIDDLWSAVTGPERIARWFLPVSGDLVEGGRYQLEGNAGGRITRCTPPHEFAVTWEYEETVSWVTVRLTAEDDDHTRLELEHAGVTDPEFWARFGPGAGGLGWDLGLLGLATHLAGHDRLADDFPGTPEGVEFLRLSSEAWCAAHMASGADPETARGMAERTLAAYTEH